VHGFDNHLISGMAGLIAGAGTRSLIDGTDFGDNIRAALPGVIANTVGNMIAGSFSQSAETSDRAKSYADALKRGYNDYTNDETGAGQLQLASLDNTDGDPLFGANIAGNSEGGGSGGGFWGGVKHFASAAWHGVTSALNFVGDVIDYTVTRPIESAVHAIWPVSSPAVPAGSAPGTVAEVVVTAQKGWGDRVSDFFQHWGGVANRFLSAHSTAVNRGTGVLQALGGAGEAVTGVTGVVGGAATSETGVGIGVAAGGAWLASNGYDNFVTGLKQAWTGAPQRTSFNRALKQMTGSQATADGVEMATSFASDAAALKYAASPGRIVADVGPISNTEFRNGYAYTFDELGRPNRVDGELAFNPAQGRNPAAQLGAGGVDRLITDDGGHYVGRRFNGPLDDFNHFAQDANFNRGAYRVLENKWQDALANGSSVTVDIQPKYVGSSLRPDSLSVDYTIDGVPYRQRFLNQSGG
jgi:hypothetical protein